MIDEKVFKDYWQLLCERFGRLPSQALLLAYYKSLSPKLDTEQFKAAAQRVFEEREFFPRPTDFLEGDRAAKESEALSQWDAVQDVMRGLAKLAGNDDLTDESRAVIRLLGGETKLRNTPLDAVQYVRRDFLAMYSDAGAIGNREHHDELPAGNGHRGGHPMLVKDVAKMLLSGPDA
jgi:hypothetical protein